MMKLYKKEKSEKPRQKARKVAALGTMKDFHIHMKKKEEEMNKKEEQQMI